MDDGQDHGEQRGLGKVVYSAEPPAVRAEREDTSGATDVIEEASEESFPASDPPGYATGTADNVAIAPGALAEATHPNASEAAAAMTDHDRSERGA